MIENLEQTAEIVEKPALETAENTVETTEQNDDYLFLDNDEGQEQHQEQNQEEKDWQKYAKKMGIEADSEDDFLEKAQKPKEVFVNDRDPAIRKLKNYLTMEDADLVKADLAARGWNKDKIERYAEAKADDIEFLAEEIRSGLNTAIRNRTNEIEGAEKQRVQSTADNIKKLNENLKAELSKTQEVLGFKVGRTPEEIKKWQEGMTSFYEKGDMQKQLNQVIKDAMEGKPEAVKSFIELGQFLKSKDGIRKGLIQKGKSAGEKKLLEELENSKEEGKGETADFGKKKGSTKEWF